MSQIDLGQVAATVAAGTVTRVPYSTPPSVTNSGTVQNAVFNFSIPSATIPIIEQTASVVEISPAVMNVWGTMTSLSIDLITPEDDTIINEYMIQFTSGSTPTTLSLPSGIVWAELPNIEANATYQISIIDNLGVIAKFSAS